jgi:hypothetical protein
MNREQERGAERSPERHELQEKREYEQRANRMKRHVLRVDRARVEVEQGAIHRKGDHGQRLPIGPGGRVQECAREGPGKWTVHHRIFEYDLSRIVEQERVGNGATVGKHGAKRDPDGERKPDAPTQGRTKFNVPGQIDREDFLRPDIPHIIVVFSSSTCNVCAQVVDTAMQFASRLVVVQNVEYSAERSLHERYSIDAVPTVLVADHLGVVTAGFTGPITQADLAAALAPEQEH